MELWTCAAWKARIASVPRQRRREWNLPSTTPVALSDHRGCNHRGAARPAGCRAGNLQTYERLFPSRRAHEESCAQSSRNLGTRKMRAGTS